jgi:hypothetical protein
MQSRAVGKGSCRELSLKAQNHFLSFEKSLYPHRAVHHRI